MMICRCGWAQKDCDADCQRHESMEPHLQRLDARLGELISDMKATAEGAAYAATHHSDDTSQVARHYAAFDALVTKFGYLVGAA